MPVADGWGSSLCGLAGEEYHTIRARFPDKKRITVYHHIAVLHLNEEQLRYFREKTDADPYFKPSWVCCGKGKDAGRFYIDPMEKRID